MLDQSVIEGNTVVDDYAAPAEAVASVFNVPVTVDGHDESMPNPAEKIDELDGADADSDQPKEDQSDTPPKFQKGQRVFAKDSNGLLYEAIVRRTMFGVSRQCKLPVNAILSEKVFDDSCLQDSEPRWHCYVHFLGWNVKWDRWVDESSLFEPSEGTRQLAKLLHAEVKAVKEKYRNTAKGAKGTKVAFELEQRMQQLERVRRAEERREQLGGVDDETEPDQQPMDNIKMLPLTKNKWSATSLKKELELRERDMQGRRKQVHAEKLVLPFTLKKVMVEEWEVITQCNVLPSLPASITVKQMLNAYLASKIEMLQAVPTADVELLPSQTLTSDVEGLQADNSVLSKVDESALDASEKHIAGSRSMEAVSDAMEKVAEWTSMVEGLVKIFDQSITSHLLYRQELMQLVLLEEDLEVKQCQKSEIYGCEHLLRLFVQLPALLAEKLSDTETRPIYSKLNDLVRYLQKHQSTLFAQTYRPSNESVLQQRAPGPQRGGAKRKFSTVEFASSKRR